MSVDQARARQALDLAGPVRPLPRAALVALTVLVLASALGYGLTVGGTYLQNGLDAVPLSEVGGGAYDPSGLPFPPSATTGLLGLVFLLLVPLVSGVGAFALGLDLLFRSTRRPQQHLLAEVLVLALCVAVFAVYLLLAQLSVWWLD